jgi:hypothetical protein
MNTSVDKQSKSLLSRLLATENILVVHDKNAQTASFDIANRVLRLPVFKNMSEELYDMFVGHEVAHALYTPFTEEDKESIKTNKCLSSAMKIADGDAKMAQIAHQYLNVVEDARIERMIKDRFPGIRRDFYIGYGELNKRDFFGIKGTDIASMSFIDRINLYFKIGYQVKIPFTDEEMQYVDMVENTKTFDDVLDVTKKIWSFSKAKASESKSDISAALSDDGDPVDATGKSGNGIGDGQPNGDQGNSKNEFGNTGKWHTNTIPPDMCRTQQNFDNNAQSLVNTSDWAEHEHYRIPEVNMDTVIVPYKDIMDQFNQVAVSYHDTYNNFLMNEAKKFIDESKRVVNILAQEFMSKKAAKDHHRNRIHRTGSIDTVRMMNHKVTDDIFRRMTVVHKGKSHGLVFYTDMSGSMSPVIDDNFRQLIQLVLFCKRVNIPFVVYGFTTKMRDGNEMDKWVAQHNDPNLNWNDYCWSFWKKDNRVIDNRCSVNPFTLIELFSSKMTKNEIELAVRNALAIGFYHNRRSMTANYHMSIPSIVTLSSTPLIEAIASGMTIVPKFKEENRLDIVHTVFLTDGEPTGINIGNNSTCSYKNHVYKFSEKCNTLDNMIAMFRVVTGSKAISFFLCDAKTQLPFGVYTKYTSSNDPDKTNREYDDMSKQYVRDGWALPVRGSHKYDEQFIIRADRAVENEDLNSVLSGRTSTVGIRNGFIKAMTKNIVSRVMLNRFIDLIAKE